MFFHRSQIDLAVRSSTSSTILFYRAKEKSWKLKLRCVRSGKYSGDLCHFRSIIFHNFFTIYWALFIIKFDKDIWRNCRMLPSFFHWKKIVSRLVFTKGTYTGEEEWVYKKKLFFLFYIYVNIPPLLNCRWFFSSFYSVFLFILLVSPISSPSLRL